MKSTSTEKDRRQYYNTLLVVGDEEVHEGEEGFLVVTDLQVNCELSYDKDIDHDHESTSGSSFCSDIEHEFQDGVQSFDGALVPSNESHFTVNVRNCDENRLDKFTVALDGGSYAEKSCANNSQQNLKQNLQEENATVNTETNSQVLNKRGDTNRGDWRKFFTDNLRLKEEAWAISLKKTPE